MKAMNFYNHMQIGRSRKNEKPITIHKHIQFLPLFDAITNQMSSTQISIVCNFSSFFFFEYKEFPYFVEIVKIYENRLHSGRHNSKKCFNTNLLTIDIWFFWLPLLNSHIGIPLCLLNQPISFYMYVQ